MSGTSLGKKLLRNVIRHTDIHNKLQEESDMWKLRHLEKHVQATEMFSPKSNSSCRGYMHCDRYEDNSTSWDRGQVRGHRDNRPGTTAFHSERDEREARYWSKKLYEFEANDPDRWGHSGFKELYPEEFKSDREDESSGEENRPKKKSKHSRKAGHKRAPSTKPSSKKKKKRGRKKGEEEEGKKKKKRRKRKKRGKADVSHSDSSDSDSGSEWKRRKVIKRKEQRRSSRSEEESGGDKERGKEAFSRRGRKRRGFREKEEEYHSQDHTSKKRKSWRTEGGDKSEDTSDD